MPSSSPKPRCWRRCSWWGWRFSTSPLSLWLDAQKKGGCSLSTPAFDALPLHRKKPSKDGLGSRVWSLPSRQNASGVWDPRKRTVLCGSPRCVDRGRTMKMFTMNFFHGKHSRDGKHPSARRAQADQQRRPGRDRSFNPLRCWLSARDVWQVCCSSGCH